MDRLRWMLLQLRAVFGRRALNDEMQAEMRDHIERHAQRLEARGLSRQAALLQARREFGNVSLLQEDARAARGARWIDDVAGDLRFAFRYFSHHKATTAIIIAVLALGIGANTIIFTAVQAEFMRPAPAVPRDDARVRLHAAQRENRVDRWRFAAFSEPERLALAANDTLFRDVAGWTAHDVVLNPGDSAGARGVGAQFVTPNFFATLGVPVLAGPGFHRQADGADLAAVMSFAQAEQLYGSPAGAVGREILVNEVPVRIVGVAPPRFQGAITNQSRPALWIPLGARAEIARVSPRWLEEPTLQLFGRMAPGASREQATAFTRQVVSQTIADTAAVEAERSAWVLAMTDRPPHAPPGEDIIVIAAVGLVGLLILLVACTNVSSLMVAAAVGRRHEIAVRLSLGASRLRILRQLLTESVLLTATGGSLALLLYWWAATYLTRRDVIGGVDVTPDRMTFLFMMALAVGTGIVFGLSPALHATRGDVARALRDSGAGATRRSRLQRAFVVAQIVFSQPLLVLLGVMLSLGISGYRPTDRALGERLVSVTFRPLTATGTQAQRRDAVDSLIPVIAEHPEVVGVVPGSAAFAIGGMHLSDTSTVPTYVMGAAPGFFGLMDTRILLGRDLTLADTAGDDRNVLVSSHLARRMFGDANPLGRRFMSPTWSDRDADSALVTVIGVFEGSEEETRPNSVYRIYTAHGKRWRRDQLLIRTRAPAEPFIPQLRTLLRDRAPSLPVTTVQTQAQIDDNERLIAMRISALAGAGGLLALLLASLGLYGVVSLAVQQRLREIGIRIAIGGRPNAVARMFLASGMRVSIVALLIGLPVSILLLHAALSNRIVIAPTLNAWYIGAGIALTLLGVAAAATWIPARRAAAVDPATTLRVE